MLSRKKKKGKVLLILDNASSHKINFTRYLNIQLFFLPPNTTSILQPCDQAINAVTKAKYKAWLDDQRFNFHADPNKSTCIKIMTRINAKLSKKTAFFAWLQAGFKPVEIEVQPSQEIEDGSELEAS